MAGDTGAKIHGAYSPWGGSGTVTSVTFTGDGTILSSTPSSAVTTNGTVTATLANTVTGSGGVVLKTSPTITTPGIVGVTNASNATAGNVGEVVKSAVATGSAVSISSSATWINITSIALTAGDWDVSGIGGSSVAGSVNTSDFLCLSQFTGNTTTDLSFGNNASSAVPATAAYDASACIPSWRVNVSSSTTVYLKWKAVYTGTAPAAYGRISARRVR